MLYTNEIMENHLLPGNVRGSGVGSLRRAIFAAALLIVGVVALYYASKVHFLLFHNLVELAAITVAFCMFLIAWNARDRTDNPNLVNLGIAYFFVGVLDLFHTLSYKGMGVFVHANFATELWIAARYLESLSLLLFLSLSPTRKRVPHEFVFGVYLVTTILLILAIFKWRIFPACFDVATGLTSFKIISEYVICAFLLCAGVVLCRRRREYQLNVFLLLFVSIVFTVVGEVCFTLYVNVYGFSNFLGHLFKFISFYLLYKAIVENGFRRPFNTVFKELKDKETLLNATQRIARVGGWEFDVETQTVTWTEEVFHIHELPLDHEVTLENALSFYTDESAIKVRETLQELLRSGGKRDLELQLRTACQRELWVRVIFATDENNGKIIRIHGVIQDVTEQKDNERLRANIERVTRHDLKNLLNPISVASQVLKMNNSSQRQNREIADIIQESVERMLNMINVSLDMFKVEEGVYEFNPHPLNLRLIVERVVKDHRQVLSANDVDVEIHEDSNCGRVCPHGLKGDETLLFSMIANLLKNAIEASPENETITIALDHGEERHVLSVSNKGRVPDEIRDKFFSKYATAGKSDGMGLGTYGVKLVAELHGGSVEMTSSEERGTTVTVTLPNSPRT